ncbi:MAG: hypothetical protein KGS45_00005 [Planctomycetes bacterium]|nr:hypothetical protein [Planctomycetota bacterium]
MSSIVGANRAEVEASIAEFAAARRGVFEPESPDSPEFEKARLTESASGITVIYADNFMEWDEIAAHLSQSLKKAVFSCHIHDSDFWMFLLFVNGEEMLKFNPIPNYFEELNSDERATWLPSAEQVARYVPGVRAERLAPYLVEWPDDELEGKAHPEDSSGFRDWQVTDFQRELGFRFCEPGDPDCYTYRLKMKNRR